ncbi:MAG: hypothetical protein IKY06_06765, partial [Clostridia bacterium]|nr:hypothetical protein [Clostridia bacterium]
MNAFFAGCFVLIFLGFFRQFLTKVCIAPYMPVAMFLTVCHSISETVQSLVQKDKKPCFMACAKCRKAARFFCCFLRFTRFFSFISSFSCFAVTRRVEQTGHLFSPGLAFLPHFTQY